MGLASSLDASIGSREDAERFMYKNNLIGRQFESTQFRTVLRIGKEHNVTAGLIAPTWVLAQGRDFRYVGYRD